MQHSTVCLRLSFCQKSFYCIKFDSLSVRGSSPKLKESKHKLKTKQSSSFIVLPFKAHLFPHFKIGNLISLAGEVIFFFGIDSILTFPHHNQQPYFYYLLTFLLLFLLFLVADRGLPTSADLQIIPDVLDLAGSLGAEVVLLPVHQVGSGLHLMPHIFKGLGHEINLNIYRNALQMKGL
jgi:hypothetical protein